LTTILKSKHIAKTNASLSLNCNLFLTDVDGSDDPVSPAEMNIFNAGDLNREKVKHMRFLGERIRENSLLNINV
jgi:hypothetical protein